MGRVIAKPSCTRLSFNMDSTRKSKGVEGLMQDPLVGPEEEMEKRRVLHISGAGVRHIW